MHTLTFAQKIIYPDDEQGINFDVELMLDINTRITVPAKLDTGSTFCIFQRKYAEALGLEVESEDKKLIRSAKGSFVVYGHLVNINFCEMQWATTVYFAQDEDFPVNVVGRIGFLNFLKIGLIDYEQILYLNSYNE